MESYKHGGHKVWECKYHLVWVTKYRYPVLGGDVGSRCRELLREFGILRKRYWAATYGAGDTGSQVAAM